MSDLVVKAQVLAGGRGKGHFSKVGCVGSGPGWRQRQEHFSKVGCVGSGPGWRQREGTLL